MSLFTSNNKEITFTLIKANKCLDKLKNASTVAKPSRYVAPVDNSKLPIYNIFRTSNTFESFNEKCLAERNKQRKLYSDQFVLAGDIQALKSAIFTKNVATGIDGLVSKISFLNGKMSKLNTIVSQLNNALDVVSLDDLKDVHTRLQCTADNSSNFTTTDPTIALPLFTMDELNEEISAISKKIFALETERDTLNATHSIKVSLSEQSCGIIGL